MSEDLGYEIKRITDRADPLYGWFLVVVPSPGKELNLVYGPYGFRGDADVVGQRVVSALAQEQ